MSCFCSSLLENTTITACMCGVVCYSTYADLDTEYKERESELSYSAPLFFLSIETQYNNVEAIPAHFFL
jgi:hypothetical protein